jgi:hypothetical protein
MMNEIVNSEIVIQILSPGLFYFSSWLPENFSDADADGYRHRQAKEQPESGASLGCGG